MDLDLHDLGLSDGPSQATTRPSRFQPKSAKLKPKPKSEPPPEESKPDALVSKKQEDSQPSCDDSIVNTVTETKGEESVAMADEDQLKEERMEEDIEEDRVVREIDVFFSPSPLDTNTQLYVLQYPLRPSWRPYELDRRCREVRVKPKNLQVEVDLSLDIDNNYDTEVADDLRIKKQTLSSRKPALTTGYAVGVLMGNKLHLKPVNAVVQLRPSMEHLKFGELKKKSNISQNAEVTVKSNEITEEVFAGPSTNQGKLVKTSTELDTNNESWVSLEYHGAESAFSSRYLQKMVLQESSPVQFSMSSYDYINSICPGSLTENKRAEGPSRGFLLSLQPDERFKTLLSEGPQVNRFNVLKHFAPDSSNEDVLGVLQRHAYLVQGLWVSKTSLLQLKGAEYAIRDYILLLFRQNTLVSHKLLDDSGLNKEILKRVLNSLAIYRPTFKDWKFKEPTDGSFLKSFPDIVWKQEQIWKEREKKIMEAIRQLRGGPAMRNLLKPSMTSKPGTSANVDQGAKRGVNGTSSTDTITITDATREALNKALVEVFRNHKVCSLQLIHESLRDQAVFKSTLPKGGAGAAVAAARSAFAHLPELQSFISQVAINIHGVYVLKSSDNPTLNPLRNVVINLFCAKQPNAKLKKADIVEAAKIALKRDISNSEYTQVLTELCVSVKGNAWVLKSGDVKP